MSMNSYAISNVLVYKSHIMDRPSYNMGITKILNRMHIRRPPIVCIESYNAKNIALCYNYHAQKVCAVYNTLTSLSLAERKLL